MKVLCMGTFDVLHPGHVAYLEQARTHGDYIVVVVARDETVVREKGKPPVVHENDRLRLVESLRLVDKAVLGYVGDKLCIVEDLRPDVVCLGYDQCVDEHRLRDDLGKRGIHPKIVRLTEYKSDKYKSKILKGLREL